jgi:hypothetical protein
VLVSQIARSVNVLKSAASRSITDISPLIQNPAVVRVARGDRTDGVRVEILPVRAVRAGAGLTVLAAIAARGRHAVGSTRVATSDLAPRAPPRGPKRRLD